MRHVRRARDVQPPLLEFCKKVLEESSGEPHVGVEKDQDVAVGAVATQGPPRRYGGRASQENHLRESLHDRDGTVLGARIDNYNLIRSPRLTRYIGEERT